MCPCLLPALKREKTLAAFALKKNRDLMTLADAESTVQNDVTRAWYKEQQEWRRWEQQMMRLNEMETRKYLEDLEQAHWVCARSATLMAQLVVVFIPLVSWTAGGGLDSQLLGKLPAATRGTCGCRGASNAATG